jgi:stage IV sporulation protein FB
LFVSILIHEFGHALTMRYFGQSSHVVLYMMGGLAIPDSANYASISSSPFRQPRNWVLVCFAGPAAGFVLAAFVIAIVHAMGGAVSFSIDRGWIPPWTIGLRTDNYYAYVLVHNLLWVNIFWGLVNLLPVYPLDGGQISRELFVHKDGFGGMQKSLWLSLITGAAIAVLGLLWYSQGERGGVFVMLLFGSLAYSSYSILQQLGGGGGGYGGGYGKGRPW